MVADRRIPELTTYFEEKEISFDFIIYQLSEYDKYREKIFEQTFALEKYLTEKHFEEIKEIEFRKDNKKEEKDFDEVQFKVFTKWLEEKKDKHPLTDDEIKELKGIRNKFSHSQFPVYKEEIGQLTKEDNESFENKKRDKGGVEALNLSIAKKVYEFYESTINKLINV